MFQDLVESAAVRKQTKQGFAAIASAAVQCMCLLFLLLLPLIYTQALPKTIMSAFLIVPPPSIVRPQPVRPAQRVRAPHWMSLGGVIHEPTAIPPTIAMIHEPPLPPDSILDSQITVAPGFDLLSEAISSAPTRPLPPVSPIKQRIRLGGLLVAAKITSQSSPVYPVLARQAGIQGDVVLHAIIDREGRVSELQVVSGSPLLARAALDAVRTWRYQPMLLNDEPVEVDTTITVSFVLGGSLRVR